MKEVELKVGEKQIIEAAIRILSKKTISGTRLHLVAQEAGISNSNIVYYFKSKKRLLLAVLNEIQRRSSERRKIISKEANSTLVDSLSGFFKSKKEMILHEKDYDIIKFDFWLQSLVDENIRDVYVCNNKIWRSDIISELDKYIPDLANDKKVLISHIMVSMMMGASMQYINEKEPVDLDSYFSLCMDMLLCVLNTSSS